MKYLKAFALWNGVLLIIFGVLGGLWTLHPLAAVVVIASAIVFLIPLSMIKGWDR